MKLHQTFLATTLAGLLALSAGSRADDIDIYTGGEQTTGAAANVLIILDNSSNWAAANQQWPNGSKQGVSELQTLSEIADTLSDNINLGMMTFAQNGTNLEGQVRFHIRVMNEENRKRFQSITGHMATNAVAASDPDEISASSNYDILMNSAFRYFNGKARYPNINNAGEDRKDHVDNPVVAAYDPAVNPAGYDWAYASAGAANYTAPPQVADGCAKNFIIFIGNGFPSGIGASAELTDAAALIGKTASTSVVTPISPRNPWADEWARFMRTYGVPSTVDDPKSTTTPKEKLNNKITTYTIDVCNAACDTSQATLLQSMARVGGGKYYKSTNKDQIKAALAAIFAEIQAVNSVFASATLPVSVNTQGTYENQVYIGVFRPDQQALPRWYGNLKQYQFARYCDLDGNDFVDNIGVAGDERIDGNASPPACTGDTLKLFLSDRNYRPAIDQSLTTGFIDLSAVSAWTAPSAYWTFLPTDSGSTSDQPDGPNVERGGAAQQLRTKWAQAASGTQIDGRRIYTCMGSCLAAGATETQRTLSNNAFYSDGANQPIQTALTPPAASVAVCDSQWASPWWNGVTVVQGVSCWVSSGHNLGSPGSTISGVTVTGASPSDYNGVKTIEILSNNQFVYYQTMTPAYLNWSSGIKVATAGLKTNNVTLTLDTTVPGATATATISSNLLANNQLVTISGATKTSGTPETVMNNTFEAISSTQFRVDLPAAPADVLSPNAGLSKTTTQSASNVSIKHHAATGLVTVTAGANLGSSFVIGASVDISGSSVFQYNGTTWKIKNLGTACTGGTNNRSYCFESPWVVKSNYTVSVQPAAGPSRSVTGFTTWDWVDASNYKLLLGLYEPGNFTPGAVGSNVMIGNLPSGFEAYGGVWPIFRHNPGDDWFNVGPYPSRPGPLTASTGISATLDTAAYPVADTLITWQRGKDLQNEDLNGISTDVRPSVHGDVLHSRPLLINYGGSLGIYGFYGSNDGFLRAVKGGLGLDDNGNPRNNGTTSTTLDDGTSGDGFEKWAFIPAEFVSYQRLRRLYNNQQAIRFPNSACPAPGVSEPLLRDYMWDGQITAYQSTLADGTPDLVYYTTNPAVTTDTLPSGCNPNDAAPTCYTRVRQTIMYAAMRRGGRAMYAFDVSVPDNPVFLWKINSSTAGFSNLGFTWSEPKVTKIKGKKADGQNDIRDVLIFGAGYDPEDDDKPAGVVRGNRDSNGDGTYDGYGHGVYIVDAKTGAKIQLLQPAAGTRKYSFPADVTLLDVDGDGYTDTVYAVDSGAQLHRFDINNAKLLDAVDAWHAHHLASFGDVGANGSFGCDPKNAATLANCDARRFLFPPEVVPFAYQSNLAFMVLVGSGDREKPLPNLIRDKLTNNLVNNALTCGPGGISADSSSSAYSAGYFGKRAYDRFYGFVDQEPRGVPSGDPPAVDSEMAEVNGATDGSVAKYNVCYAFRTDCDVTVSNPTATNAIKKGWYVTFKNDTDGDGLPDEEKLVSAPRVVSGTVLFGSNTPQLPDTSKGICSNLGEALAYAVDPFGGVPTFDRNGDGLITQADFAAVVTGGGLPPTVTAGVVSIAGSYYRFVIGAGGQGAVSASPIAGAKNPISISGNRSRVYWYNLSGDER